MKKILLILAAAATTLAASSQTKELDNLAKRLQKSDEAIADPKKSASATPKRWSPIFPSNRPWPWSATSPTKSSK